MKKQKPAKEQMKTEKSSVTVNSEDNILPVNRRLICKKCGKKYDLLYDDYCLECRMEDKI